VTDSPDLEIAGALVQLARIRTGLSKSELARRAGVPRSEIYETESGRRQPSIPVLMKILRGAGLELRLHLDLVDDQNAVLKAILEKLTPDEQATRRARHERNVAAFASAQTR
jgi:transcriptional regulator with XRE-family HTH domain